ncbi:MAG: M23 family metallopeptidase [Muribaculaceae bacterium]|nr:M23 family metallopeptidase [Muribaculaceae bacterium]
MALKTPKVLSVKAKKNLPRTLRARSRWRVEIVNENTLSRVWSFRLTGLAARIAPLVVIAAVGSLIVVILAFTPAGRLLPGRLAPEERAMYADMAVRADSLERVVGVINNYASNIRAILNDSVTPDPTELLPAQSADSLAGASEAELRFVQQFEQKERFKLSVLTPLAADGMIFEQPFTPQAGGTAVSAIFRGTVISSQWMPEGWWSVTVQHPNDFLSVYAPLTDVYVSKGARVVAGQRIGTGSSPSLELWHAGSEIDPTQYIPD